MLRQRIKIVNDIWGPNGGQPSETDYKEEMAKIRKDIVDFHGEMVLLVNYSNVNYQGMYSATYMIKLIHSTDSTFICGVRLLCSRVIHNRLILS